MVDQRTLTKGSEIYERKRMELRNRVVFSESGGLILLRLPT